MGKDALEQRGNPTPISLVAARALAAMSQVELARLAAVHVNVVKRYESGSTDIRAGTRDAFVRILNTRGVFFLEDDIHEGAFRLKDLAPSP